MYTPPTEIYTLSLHDALPISAAVRPAKPLSLETSPAPQPVLPVKAQEGKSYRDYGLMGYRRNGLVHAEIDRKSTRLNSSHANISYAVFCLKKKKKKTNKNKNK